MGLVQFRFHHFLSFSGRPIQSRKPREPRRRKRTKTKGREASQTKKVNKRDHPQHKKWADNSPSERKDPERDMQETSQKRTNNPRRHRPWKTRKTKGNLRTWALTH